MRGVGDEAQRSAPTLFPGGTVPTNSYLSGLPRTPQPIRPRRIYQRRLVMRTAIYVRISTLTHSQQHSIEEQIERLRTLLLSRGVQAADEHVFRDEGRERRHSQPASPRPSAGSRAPWRL